MVPLGHVISLSTISTVPWVPLVQTLGHNRLRYWVVSDVEDDPSSRCTTVMGWSRSNPGFKALISAWFHRVISRLNIFARVHPSRSISPCEVGTERKNAMPPMTNGI